RQKAASSLTLQQCQIKTFRLKYVFLAAKIIKTARYVIMKLSENYPYKGVYEKCLV
ncbi:transposase, partial [Salmonella enterica subsp. enterica serovar Infantis]|nr:transposase [Salmonella enterica subsp. enterica serovar Infantis]